MDESGIDRKLDRGQYERIRLTFPVWVIGVALFVALGGCAASNPAMDTDPAQSEPASKKDTRKDVSQERIASDEVDDEPPPMVAALKSPQVVSIQPPEKPPQIRPLRKPKTPYAVLGVHIAKTSRRYKGYPYSYGANPDKKKGADCSNFISAAVRNSVSKGGYRFKPYYLTTVNIRKNTYPIKRKNLRMGDLIYFNKGSATKNHAGVITKISPKFVTFTHASSSKGVIDTSTASNSWRYYWVKRFNSFRRWKSQVFVAMK